MSEMVERVAEVLNRFGICDWKLETCRAGQCQCMAGARAAIEAMREPTAAMVKRAAASNKYVLAVHCNGIWQHMIDEALK